MNKSVDRVFLYEVNQSVMVKNSNVFYNLYSATLRKHYSHQYDKFNLAKQEMIIPAFRQKFIIVNVLERSNCSVYTISNGKFSFIISEGRLRLLERK